MTAARAAVRIQSTAGSITASGLAGDVEAETVGGRIRLSEVSGENVRVTSTGADIEIAGRPRPGGVYDLASQAGSVTLRCGPAIRCLGGIGLMRAR